VRCGFRPGSTADGRGTPASLVAVVYPLLEGRSLGWPGWIWLLLAAGLAGLAALAWVEARRQHGRVAPLMQPQLFRIPAFRAGLVVQLLFRLGVQGFFLILALWIQAGTGFSPLGAGLTALGFSAGSFLLAPVAVPFAERYGRLVLASGGGAPGGWLRRGRIRRAAPNERSLSAVGGHPRACRRGR
jgi:hypothetical protein